jgi:hypothetical protein
MRLSAGGCKLRSCYGYDEKLSDRAKQFSFNEVEKLADFIEDSFIKPRRIACLCTLMAIPLNYPDFPGR